MDMNHGGMLELLQLLKKKAFARHVKVLWKEEKKQELTNRKKEETMGKVFGYPEFDENGEQILTTYDNEYKDMLMDVRVYRMKAGDEKSFQKTGEETAVLLLSGSIEFVFDDVTAKADRKDVFTEGPWCVQIVRSLFSQQRMIQSLTLNYINQKMLHGDILLLVNLEMWQNAV